MQPSVRPSGRRRVRTIFLSDVHLGSRYSHADQLLSYLEAYDPDYVYIVGDFIDGWSLRRSWRWHSTYSRVLDLLFDWARRGVTIRYAPGNHDEFLRDFLSDFRLFEVADQFLHYGPDGQRYLITHGDQFDTVELRARWLSLIGGLAYDLLLWTNHVCNGIRRCFRLEPARFSTTVKVRVKKVVTELSAFEQRLGQHAQARHCDAIVCGHVHVPTISQRGPVTYCNTGDWVENCTALLEDFDGTLRIEQYVASSAEEGFRQLQSATVQPAMAFAATETWEPCRIRKARASQEASLPTADWQSSSEVEGVGEALAESLVGTTARSKSSV